MYDTVKLPSPAAGDADTPRRPSPGAQALAPVRTEPAPLPGGLLRALLDHPDYAIVVVDPELRVTFANACFTRISGYSQAALEAGQGNPFAFAGLDAATLERVRSALARLEAVACRQVLEHRAGHRYDLEMTVQPIHDAAGRHEGWLALGRDVSAEARLRDQFQAHAARLQLTLESARMGTWEVDRDTGGIAVDDSWLQLSGISPAERDKAGDLWRERIHPEDRDIMLQRIDGVLDGSADVQRSQYRVIRPDGRMMWVQDTSRVTARGPDGHPRRLVGVVADITALKRAIASAEQSAERLWMATEAAALGVWDHDLLNASYYFSERMREIHGLPPGNHPLAAYAALTHPDDRTRAAAAIALGRRADRPFELQFRIIRPDGEIRHLEVYARVQMTPDGRPSRAVGITRDVTDQVRLALEREQAQKLESVGRLAAGIAHEINTPSHYVSDNLRFVADALASIAPLLRCVQAPGLEDEAGDVVARIREDADAVYALGEMPQAIDEALDGMERITSIVRAMNSFSHPGTHRTPLDINKAIASTVTVARREWAPVARLETDLDASLPLVEVVPGEFNQVMLNLIVNAAHAVAEATQTDGREGLIRIATGHTGHHAEIVVADTGCGMAPEVQDRMFDPFFTTKPVGQGTGQGLALVHGFLAAHGGSISVDSTPGQGTQLTLRLPLKAPTREGASVMEP